jgi:hypothetical protein
MIELLPEKKDPYICLVGIINAKNIVLVREKSILFTLYFQSLDADLTSFDVRHIRMTINYCVQHLGLEPALAIIVGNIAKQLEVDVEVDLANVSLASLAIPRILEEGQQELFNEFFFPISAICLNLSKDQTKYSSNKNLVPKNYKKFCYLKDYLKYSAMVFLTITFLLGVSVQKNIFNIFSFKKDLKDLRTKHINLPEVLKAYQEKREEFRKKERIINFINSRDAENYLHSFLKDFSYISLSGLKIKALDIKLADALNNSGYRGEMLPVNVLAAVEIKGEVETTTYRSGQEKMERLKADLLGIDKITEVAYRFDLSQKTFIVNFRILKEEN